MHYLLDTNIISYLADEKSPHRQAIKDKFLNLNKNDKVSVSIITLYELSYGVHSFDLSDANIEILKRGIAFIQEYLDVIPLGVNEVDIFGLLKAKYKKHTGIPNKAHKKNDLDFLILATAINHNATLISNDEIFTKMIELEPRIGYEVWLK